MALRYQQEVGIKPSLPIPCRETEPLYFGIGFWQCLGYQGCYAKTAAFIFPLEKCSFIKIIIFCRNISIPTIPFTDMFVNVSKKLMN